MNNELIERIDAEIAIIEQMIDNLAVRAPNVEPREWMSRSSVLKDCKAALTQQQEAELVFAVKPLDIEALKSYKGQCTMLARRADQAPSNWTRVYLHPPKPAAQPQVPDALQMRPFQTINTESENYKAGWNACRKAMLSAAKEEARD